MPAKGTEIVDFKALLLHETEKAYLFRIEGQSVWLAKSQVEWDGEEVTMPRWLADEKELT